MNEIYNYIKNELRGYALRLCDYRKHETEDLIQDTSLKMWEKYRDKPLTEQKKIATTVMGNLHKDYWRRRYCEPFVVTNQFPELEIMYSDCKEIFNFICGQKYKSFESLKLFVEGYKVKEIQTIYGDKTINVPLHNIHRARKKTKEYFNIAV